MPFVKLVSILLLASLVSCGLKTDPRPPQDTDIKKIGEIPTTNNKTKTEIDQTGKQIPKDTDR